MQSLRGQQGYLLLVVPAVVIAITLLGYQMMSRTKTSMRIAASDLDYLHAQLCSQQCVAVAANRVQASLEGSNPVPVGASACRCPADPAEKMACGIEIGPPTEKTARSCYGFYYKSTEVDLGSRCQGMRAGKSELEERVAYGEIPIFQFAVFYDKFLPLENTPRMELEGMVHSNDTIAIGPTHELYIHDWVTSPKAILGSNGWNNGAHGGSINRIYFARADGSGPDNAPVRPATNGYRPLREIIPGWKAWKKSHRVAYGGEPNGCGEVKPLGLPIRGLDGNYTLIEGRNAGDDDSRRRQKFAWKSTLCYYDGWKGKDFRPVFFPSDPAVVPASPSGWETVTVAGRRRVALWNGRDEMMVMLIPVDVALLQARGASDSIVYLYDDLSDASQGNRLAGGFLLYNGRRLTRPQTIVTNSRLYVMGDYNTDSAYAVSGVRHPFPAALISDNFTLLSNDFIPSEHTRGKYMGSRVQARNPGARVILNSCIMTGFAYRGAAVSDWGGHENLIRYEEDWSGLSFHYSGSAVSIWSPRHSQSQWNRPGPTYYTAPSRLFSFSKLYEGLTHMPPGTPRVVAPGLLDWEMVKK